MKVLKLKENGDSSEYDEKGNNFKNVDNGDNGAIRFEYRFLKAFRR